MTREKTDETEPARESIWSVPLAYRAFYFTLFISQCLIGVSFVIWHEIWINDSDTFYETVAAIIVMDVAVMIHSAGTGVIASELKMVIAQYLEQKYYGPRRRKALAEAEAKGREEGLQQANAKFRAWNERRLDAESKGESFDEPPPMGDEPDE